MNKVFGAALAVVLAVAGASAGAATIFSSGAGSAVTSIDASADFESRSALFSGYEEDGLLFARSQNLCGFAGCGYHGGFFGGSDPFSGNYIYGYNIGQIEATEGNIFRGLELKLGTGYYSTSMSISWSTFLGDTLVGSGTTGPLRAPTIVGWFDVDGFDKLVFNDARGYAAFDAVKAEYALSEVPLPATGVLLLCAIGGIGIASRRRSAA